MVARHRQIFENREVWPNFIILLSTLMTPVRFSRAAGEISKILVTILIKMYDFVGGTYYEQQRNDKRFLKIEWKVIILTNVHKFNSCDISSIC